MKIQILLGASAVAASALALPPANDTPRTPCANRAAAHDAMEKTILQTAAAAGDFTTLAKLLELTELTGALEGEGPFTVFAPTDAAFAKLDEKVVESLLKEENRDRLRDILTFHVVAGEVAAKQVVKLTTATSLNGQRVDIAVDEKARTVRVDGALVTTTDIRCSNGIIHVIDEVILPVSENLVEVAAGAKTFTTLLAAAKAAGLAETLAEGGPFTVFAPTDEAFAKLPEGTVESLLEPENKAALVAVLKNHVVEGRVYADQAAKLDAAPTIGGGRLPLHIGEKEATVAGASIVATDIEASNGVIHVVDAVLVP